MAEENIKNLRSLRQWDSLWKSATRPKTFRNAPLFYLQFNSLMKKHVKEGSKLLEIGCGGGKFLVYFGQNFNCELFGIDYSPAGYQLAQKNLELSGLRGTVVCEDVFNCRTIPKQSFDVVFSGGFIEHFDDPELVLKKHIEYLKPGGLLIIEVPNITGLQGFVLRTLESACFFELKPLPAKMLENILSKLGLKIRESTCICPFLLETGGKPKILQPIFHLFNRIMYFILKTLHVFPSSERICGYIVIVAQKPFGNQKQANRQNMP